MSNFGSDNELVFTYPTFDKKTIKQFLDYCYGIEGWCASLNPADVMELCRFANKGPVRN